MPYPIKIIAWLIYACWLVFFIYWLTNAKGNKKNLYEKDKPWLRVFLILLAIMASWLVARYERDFWIVPYSKITQILGVILCAFGVGWAIWARRVLGTNWSIHPAVKEQHELIRSGPYNITRHPIYTGMVAAFLGTFLAILPTWIGLGFVVLGIVGFYFKLSKEEQLMTQTFPEAYPVYKQKVRATLIPYIF